MSREEAKQDLIKVWRIASIIGVAISAYMTFTMYSCVYAEGIVSTIAAFVLMSIFMAFLVGGIPIGWRWAGTIIVATSIIGILEKAAISLVLGWFALGFYTIRDVVYIIKNEEPTS